MENKYNMDDVNAWLKEKYGMSYDELSKEFEKAVDLLSESLKQRKEMRDKIDKAIEFIEKDLLPSHSIEKTRWDYEEVIFSDLSVERIKPLIDILKEDE
jgi:uncharacterized membrane-anchored protein YjiN (DUF445 family)